MTEGDTLYRLEQYEEALAAYEQAIHLDPNCTAAYKALLKLKRPGESKETFNNEQEQKQSLWPFPQTHQQLQSPQVYCPNCHSSVSVTDAICLCCNFPLAPTFYEYYRRLRLMEKE